MSGPAAEVKPSEQEPASRFLPSYAIVGDFPDIEIASPLALAELARLYDIEMNPHLAPANIVFQAEPPRLTAGKFPLELEAVCFLDSDPSAADDTHWNKLHAFRQQYFAHQPGKAHAGHGILLLNEKLNLDKSASAGERAAAIVRRVLGEIVPRIDQIIMHDGERLIFDLEQQVID